MKNAICLIALIFLSVSAIAQKKEISFSYSPLSAYRLGHVTQEGLNETNHFVLGAINFDYYSYLNSWLKVGVNVMYDYEKEEGTFNSYYYQTDNYELTNSVWVIAPQVDFEYLHNPAFKLSSGLSLGYTTVNSSASTSVIKDHAMKNGFIFHINLISFRWGRTRGLCGYMGLGHKGFLGLGYFAYI
ncbi:hypothetical protein [Carboxylicivirga sp. N1Y90]|uniref:hypothetical protein n=1 Tax=Carboxylicivirga fragile TaxID=3417571 RepID=UPI003D346A2B|nr:hypothetical protein [Marinilabiliaceae bacterium N1Y90]